MPNSIATKQNSRISGACLSDFEICVWLDFYFLEEPSLVGIKILCQTIASFCNFLQFSWVVFHCLFIGRWRFTSKLHDFEVEVVHKTVKPPWLALNSFSSEAGSFSCIWRLRAFSCNTLLPISTHLWFVSLRCKFNDFLAFTTALSFTWLITLAIMWPLRSMTRQISVSQILMPWMLDSLQPYLCAMFEMNLPPLIRQTQLVWTDYCFLSWIRDEITGLPLGAMQCEKYLHWNTLESCSTWQNVLTVRDAWKLRQS